MRLLLLSLIVIALTTTAFGQNGKPQQAAISPSLATQIYRPQKRSATCWAACNSMLLASEGIDSSEEDQIQRMRPYMPNGGLNGAGAHFFNASQALSGNYGGRTVRAWFIDRRTPPVDMSMNKKFVSLIQQGKPVMVATAQHGMIAIAVQFTILPNGVYAISEILVNDPAQPQVRSRWLGKEELGALFGFMAIEVTKENSNGSGGRDQKSQNNKYEKAQVNLTGTWVGVLGDLGLTIVFRIQKTDRGYVAQTDSPNQRQYGFNTVVSITDNEVGLEIATPVPSTFSGKLREAILEGTFYQGGRRWPLTLRKR